MIRIVVKRLANITSWFNPNIEFVPKIKIVPKPKLIGPKMSLRMGIHWD